MKELMSRFRPGAELSRAFYNEAVRPVLDRHFPGLVHSAAKLHGGSDVLGFDTPQSMDHDWGAAKLDLFFTSEDCDVFAKEIGRALAAELPHEFRGLPTDFLRPEVDGGTIGRVAEGPVSHRMTCTTIDRFFRGYIGLNPLQGMAEADWLVITPQYLRTISSGPVFHDGLGQLTEARNTLSWYPTDVWLYLLACQWGRIDQESPFMARCGDVGDELGSRLVAARMIDELMKLCFLMEREYWPYSKWFGSAFARLKAAETLVPIFLAILDSQAWQERQRHLSVAYICVAEMHNALGLTDFIEPRTVQFHLRPYQAPEADRFAAALYERIESATVRQWPRHVGAVAQFVHSTDVLDSSSRCKRLKVVYAEGAHPSAADDADQPRA